MRVGRREGIDNCKRAGVRAGGWTDGRQNGDGCVGQAQWCMQTRRLLLSFSIRQRKGRLVGRSVAVAIISCRKCTHAMS